MLTRSSRSSAPNGSNRRAKIRDHPSTVAGLASGVNRGRSPARAPYRAELPAERLTPLRTVLVGDAKPSGLGVASGTVMLASRLGRRVGQSSGPARPAPPPN